MFTFRLFACEIKLLLEDPLMKHIIFLCRSSQKQTCSATRLKDLRQRPFLVDSLLKMFWERMRLDEDKLFMKQRPIPKTSDVLGNFDKMRFDKGKAHISKLKTTS